MMNNQEKKLTIAVEAIALGEVFLSGVGNLALNYLKQMQRLDHVNRYILYSMRPCKHFIHAPFAHHDWKLIDGFNKIREKILSGLCDEKRNSFFTEFFLKMSKTFFTAGLIFLQALYRYWLPFSLWRRHVDIYISTSAYFYPPFIFSHIKKISFVYDLTWKLFPETLDPGNLQQMLRYTEKNMKKTDHLVSISENTKCDAMKLLDLSVPHTVIPPAADNDIFYPVSHSGRKKVKGKYGITKDYILSVCTLEPRKNLTTLMQAYETIHATYPYQLVLVGKTGWLHGDLMGHINDFDIRNNVVLTGFVPFTDLAPLYSGAEVLVYPSFYEGFGLPVLEAMQCGCPVIASDNSSIPEVLGDAGLLIPTNNKEALVQAIEKVLSNEDIRKKMTEKGLKRAERFSWETSALQLMELYD